MLLRIDALLDDLRNREAEVLAAIDADPLLLKRESGPLVLANATQRLYTPAEQHQLYAKGIVYRRAPYRLVSLPLIKIYNVGERGMTAAELSSIAAEPGTRLRFLRKLDGSLVQAFWADGKAWLTTRGMLEGAAGRYEDDEENRVPGFDFLANARQIAETRYPALLTREALEGRTLLFELLHPAAPKITNYGQRADLVLHSCFDHGRYQYLDYPALAALAGRFGLTAIDALSPIGATLAEQIDSVLAQFKGTDEEGSVVCFEREGHVTYRVKVKTPDYFQLMRLMAFCTYARTVEHIDISGAETWEQLKAHLQAQGNDLVPEEVLVYYREYWDEWQAYLADLTKIATWAEAQRAAIDAAIGGSAGRVPNEYRKLYALEATRRPEKKLLFAALDGRLDRARMRKIVPGPKEAREVLASIGP